MQYIHLTCECACKLAHCICFAYSFVGMDMTFDLTIVQHGIKVVHVSNCALLINDCTLNTCTAMVCPILHNIYKMHDLNFMLHLSPPASHCNVSHDHCMQVLHKLAADLNIISDFP